MANILVSYCGVFIDGKTRDFVFYEGLLKALSDAGNNVLRINTNGLIVGPFNGSNEIRKEIDQDKLFEKIKNFKPDLIMAFNFSSLEKLDKIFDCPYLVMEADLFHFYNDKEYLRKNQDRFIFFNTGPKGSEDTKNFFGLSDDLMAITRYGTVIQNNPTAAATTNISFIGTLFQTPWHISQKLRSSDRLPYENFEEGEIMSIDSARERITVLDAVADLGLDLYGSPEWINLAEYFYPVAASYRPDIVYSVEHNQNVYNRSLIGLNISHKQAIDAFAWRVMDIMASNSCLVTNKNMGIEEFTAGYVDIPHYESPSEARDKISRLLNDETHRREIVQASQACIEEKGRWPGKFENIYDACNVKINNVAKGSVEFINYDEYFTSKEKAFRFSRHIATTYLPHPLLRQLIRAKRILLRK